MNAPIRIFFSVLAVFALASVSYAEDPSLPELRKAALLNESHCQNVIRSDADRMYIGFGSYLPRENTRGALRVIHLRDPGRRQTLATADGVVDVASVGDRLFALTYSSIEEWDLADLHHVASYPTYLISRDLEYKEHATGFYYYDHRFFISHGRLGYSVFDITQNRIVDQKRLLTGQLPLESMAVDISGSGNRAVLAIDNFSLPVPNRARAFRGLIVLDLDTGRVVRQQPGLDPGAESIQVVGDSVFLGFNPWIWKVKLNDVYTRPKVVIDRAIVKYPGGEYYALKKSFFDEKNMYGCFALATPQGDYPQKPVVFSREELGL